ncbi:MAG: methyltransferase domain-containing protein [Acidimicrobiia bacterium]
MNEQAPTPSRGNPIKRAGKNVARKAGNFVGPHLLARVDHIDEQLEWVRGIEPRIDTGEIAAKNLELMKAEFRGLQATVEALGLAIAPGTGLDGAAERMTELRERLNALDRRVRVLGATAGTIVTDENTPAANGFEDIPTEVPAGGSGFDYIGFEQRFRGDPAAASRMLADRYLPLLRDRGSVLDIGCGRGELIEQLVASGIDASGVDTDADMVEDARRRNVTTHHNDGASYLRSLPEHSLGAITAIHVVEHIPIGPLVEMLELVVTRLAPGGIFIAETPNPASLIVLGNSYVLDPSHVWPMHPALMSLLCERAGFADIELQYFSPATDYHLPLIEQSDEVPEWTATINAAFEKLNTVLFGPQEYAVIARVR